MKTEEEIRERLEEWQETKEDWRGVDLDSHLLAKHVVEEFEWTLEDND